MFTGIISATTKIARSEQKNSSLLLSFVKPRNWKVKPGDSIATDGVCLTVATVRGNSYTTELMPETLSRTTFGRKTPVVVNLEQPLKLSDRVNGHFVTGHVDSIGTITEIKKVGRSSVYKISYPAQFKKLVAAKGSIAINGVSLTIVAVGKNWFTVSLVDYTLRHTTFVKNKTGDSVNLEFDILAKYIHHI